MAKTGTKRGKRWVAVAVLLLLAVASAGACAWWWHARFIDAPIDTLSPGQTVMVESGDSFPKVLGKLRAVGVQAGSDLQWRLLARQMDVASKLKVGEYALEPGMSPRRLLLALRSGRIIQYRFTLVEGWNIRQLRTALAAASPLRQETASLDNAELMQALGQPEQHPEGRFLPETYLYSRGDSDLDVLRRAHAAMQTALAEAWESRDPDLPLRSADEALILASIIEKETGVADERPQIAGVFVRRLKIGMRLQTDPTVIYGIGADYDGNIRRRDLTTDTPYNTYTRDGLTPTPIAMPGRAALQAAVHPAPGDTLYFVAVGDGSGRHVFTRNLGEHNAAVAAYLQQLRQRRATGRTESQ